MKNIIIRLRNMKAVRLGKGIEESRQIAKLSRKQLAEKVGITESDLCRLEEGYVSDLDNGTIEVLENIAQVVGLCKRGKPTVEELVNLFLYLPKDDRPILI